MNAQERAGLFMYASVGICTGSCHDVCSYAHKIRRRDYRPDELCICQPRLLLLAIF